MYREELARRNFWQFCLYWDRPFFEKRPFLKVVADALQLIATGAIMTLAVSMPPRAGKSYITSLFCAWWLGKNSDKTVMRNCANANLYKKFSYDIRAMLKEPRYAAVYPDVLLSPDRQDIAGWSITSSKQGAYFGAGVGGSIIGFGANLAITDDLYADFAEALSTTVNESTHLWKQGAHDSRKELGCPEIYIGTRWSKRDVIGKAIDNGVDRVISIPALDDNGRSFCENVKSTDEYLKMRDDNDEMVWQAEYMQQPIEAFGLLFPIDELKFYDPSLELEGEYHFIPIDPANKGGDFFASAHMVLVGNSVYIPHVFCNKEGSDTSNILHEQYIRANQIDSIEYEGVLQWQATACKLRDQLEDLEIEFRITKPTTNKQTRILVQAPWIKNHVYFREDWKSIPEYRTFINLLTSYLRDQTGNNKAPNDDPPDVLAAGAAKFKRDFAHLF